MSWLDAIIKMTPLGRYYSTPPALQNGQLSELQLNDLGELLVSTNGRSAGWQDTAAPSNERTVKSTAGKLFQIAFQNTGAADLWIFIYDVSARPADGGYPRFIPLKVGAGQTRALTFARPRAFANGIYWGASTTGTTFTFAAAYPVIMSTAEYI